MDSLNPVEAIAGIVVQGIVLGCMISVAIPVSRLIMTVGYKGYKKVRRIIKGPEVISVPRNLVRTQEKI